MVLGIGEGKIAIATEKTGYGQGELLKGRVMLQLNSPKKAKMLRIRFYGEQRQSHASFSMGKTRTSASTVKIMEQEITLDGEREYPAGQKEYEFQFQLPTIPKPQQSADTGIMGAVAALAMSAADPYRNVTWYLDASLDLPMSFDISKKQIVNLVR